MRYYYYDLTYYTCHYFENSKNIGWIDNVAYKSGDVPIDFIGNLYKYIEAPIRAVRDCFDPQEIIYNGKKKQLGYFEIRVLSEDGKIKYASPDLIFYYVLKNRYKPPQEFINAVLYGPKPGSELCENYMMRYKEEYLWGESGDVVSLSNKLKKLIYENDLKGLDKLLFEKSGNMEIITTDGSLLNTAIKAHNFDIVKYLVGKNVNINKFSGEELNTAIVENMDDISKFLVEKNIMIDLRTHVSNPLFTAVLYENYEMVEFLLSKGIDITVTYSNSFAKDMTILDILEKDEEEIRDDRMIKLFEKYKEV